MSKWARIKNTPPRYAMIVKGQETGLQVERHPTGNGGQWVSSDMNGAGFIVPPSENIQTLARCKQLAEIRFMDRQESNRCAAEARDFTPYGGSWRGTVRGRIWTAELSERLLLRSDVIY